MLPFRRGRGLTMNPAPAVRWNVYRARDPPTVGASADACPCARPQGLGSVRLHLRSLAHPRSEEYTSELQSQSNLVCRLLLEKKKKKYGLHRNKRRSKTFTIRFNGPV